MRCGTMWGTKCQAWVEPPSYTHGDHGALPAHHLHAVQSFQCPPQVLEMLSGQQYQEHLRIRAVSHRRCPIPVLRRLATDPSWSVRAAVASHPRCPPALLVQLVHDPEDEVQAVVASRLHLDTDRPLLAQLARTGGYGTKRVVAGNRHTSGTTLRHLAHSDHIGVRWQVASNPSCGPRTLLTLTTDPISSVREAAQTNPSLPEEYRLLKQLVR